MLWRTNERLAVPYYWATAIPPVSREENYNHGSHKRLDALAENG